MSYSKNGFQPQLIRSDASLDTDLVTARSPFAINLDQTFQIEVFAEHYKTTAFCYWLPPFFATNKRHQNIFGTYFY